MAGSKFYFLRGDAVLLELGLVRYAIDILTQRGYQPTITPDLARDEIVGTGFIPRGPETQIYSVEDSDLSSSPPPRYLAGSLADEMIDENELPYPLWPASRTVSAPRPAPTAARAAAYTASTSSPRWRCSPSRLLSNQKSCTRRCSTSRSASSRGSGSLTAS